MHPTLYTNRTIARRVVRARDVRLIVAVTVAGSVAAVVATPVLWISTAAIVALLAVVQHRQSEVDVRDDRRLQSLPLPIQRALRSTLAGLPPGDAKKLLNAVGRQAAILFAARASTVKSRPLARCRTEIREPLARLTAREWTPTQS